MKDTYKAFEYIKHKYDGRKHCVLCTDFLIVKNLHKHNLRQKKLYPKEIPETMNTRFQYIYFSKANLACYLCTCVPTHRDSAQLAGKEVYQEIQEDTPAAQEIGKT